jgi:hypothetical protein
VRVERNPRLQQIMLWSPGTSPRPLGPSSDWILTPQVPGEAGIAYVQDYRRIILLRPQTARASLLAPVGATSLAWSSRGTLAAVVAPETDTSASGR